jgi:hypothetical protein
VLSARRRQTAATLQIQHRFQDRLAMNERAVFLMTVCVTRLAAVRVSSRPLSENRHPFPPNEWISLWKTFSLT